MIEVSAPASTMLMGEHAVLFGHSAIACAVAKRLTVSLQPRSDDRVLVDSSLGQFEGVLQGPFDSAELSFVMAAIERLAPHCRSGFELSIQAGFSHTWGLGSSAAVTAATVAALCAYAELDTGPDNLLEHSLAVVHKVQGRGSGTDLAASIFGGLIRYQLEPRQVQRLPGVVAMGLYYSGYKTRTPVVLEQVAQQAQQLPELYTGIYQMMGQICRAAGDAIGEQDWSKLGRLMNLYQGQMDALGVSDLTLSQMIYRLRQASEVLGVKISGSGLGDCVISLGLPPENSLEGYESLALEVDPHGVIIRTTDL